MTTQTAQTLFATAEVDYRLDRAASQFPHTRPRPRHRVRRRHTLHLPRPLPAA